MSTLYIFLFLIANLVANSSSSKLLDEVSDILYCAITLLYYTFIKFIISLKKLAPGILNLYKNRKETPDRTARSLVSLSAIRDRANFVA